MKNKKCYVEKKNIILVGLPASGKTTWAEKYIKTSSNNVKHINIDKEIENEFTSCKNTKTVIKTKYDSYYTINIIDGLFTTNDDIVRVINLIPKRNLEIHYWIPNIDNCLYNDIGRRKINSKADIKNLKIEKVDLDKIKKETGYENIELIEHEVIKKPLWLTKENELNNVEIKDGVLRSSEWCIGGTGGNCWGDTWQLETEEHCNFDEFDNLLELFCPNITFLTYKKLWNNFVTIEDEDDYGYYGSHSIDRHYECNLYDLFSELENLGLIKRRD